MLAICPNPTIDRLVVLDELHPGTVARARENRAYPAGKSVSAARGSLANGARRGVLVLLPTEGSDWYLDTLRAEGMDVTAHTYPGAVRESIIVHRGRRPRHRPERHRRPGRRRDLGRLRAAAVDRGPSGRLGDLQWQLPARGGAAVRLAGLVAAIAGAGGRLALDTGPAWMPLALAGLPCRRWSRRTWPRPRRSWPGTNAVEAHRGRARRPRPAAATAAAGLRARGIGCCRGHRRCGRPGVGGRGTSAGVMAGQSVSVRNPIGAGDAFLGGLVARLEQGAAVRAGRRPGAWRRPAPRSSSGPRVARTRTGWRTSTPSSRGEPIAGPRAMTSTARMGTLDAHGGPRPNRSSSRSGREPCG